MSTPVGTKDLAELSLQDGTSVSRASNPILDGDGQDCRREEQLAGDQPLALVLAAAYVRDKIESTPSLRIDDAADLASMAVQVSFDLVHSEVPRAADILSIMSVLATSSIPEALLYHPENETLRSFHAAVRKLRTFALVEVSDDGTMLFLNPQVRMYVQAELRRQHALSKWERVAVKILSRAFPSGDSSYWRACDVLMPHVHEVLAYDLVYKEDDALRMKHAALLRNVASFLEYRGDFNAAFDKLNEALKLYGSDDRLDDGGFDERTSNILAIEAKIVQMLLYQERLKEAEERATKVREKLLKASKRSETRRLKALEFSNTLASILHRQGRHNEAKQFYLEALEANIALRHLSNADAFNIRNNLAGLYVDMGDYQAAESEHREILADQEKIFGPKHHNTIYTRRLLARAISAQGHYADATEMDEAALAAAEEVLGPRHPDTVAIKSDLAQLAEKLGDFTKSEMLHRDVLECRLQGYQVDNAAKGQDKVNRNTADNAIDPRASVINSQMGLGVILERQGRYDEAVTFLETASKSALEVLGEMDPITLKVRSTLGLVYLRQGDFANAESMIAPLLAANQALYGDNHPQTLGARNNLGGCLQRLRRWEDAIYHHRKTMEAAADPTVLGAKHPFALRSRNNVAEVLREAAEDRMKDLEQDTNGILQMLAEAEELQLQAWKGRQEVLGPDHPDTLTSCFNLGQILHAQKRYPEALEKYQSTQQGFLVHPNLRFPIVEECRKKIALLEQEETEPPRSAETDHRTKERKENDV